MTNARPPEVLIRQRLSILARALPVAQGGDPTAIHQARVATRRLRAVLPLVTRGSRGRKLGKLARRLTRALGSVRELDVALATLDELQAEAGAPGEGITRLRQVVLEERQRLCADMTRQLERSNLDRFRKKALAVARRHQPPRGRPGARGAMRLAPARRRVSRRAAALLAAIENAGGIYLPDRLHQVRIAVKKLRYAMEVTRELSGSRATARIRTLKAAQDLLGRMHDLEVLIMRIRALQGSDNAPSLKASAELDGLVRRLETECRQLHVRYMGFKKKLLDVCNDVTARADGRRSTSA